MSLAKDVCDWFTTLNTKRVNFDNLWQDIVDYILPTKRDIIKRRMPGEKKTRFIFDSTAPYGINILSEFIQGAVFNPATKWFSQQPRRAELLDEEEIRNWIENTTDQMLLTLRQTNFYKSAGETVVDWVGFGNGALLIEDVTTKRDDMAVLRYTSIPCGTYVIGEGEDGKIDKFIRCLTMTLNEAYKEFGEKLSSSTLRRVQKEPFAEIEFLHAIMPRDFVALPKGKLVTNKEMPFASYWVEKEQKTLVRESGYRKFPVAVARWDIIAGEVYGRGPGEISLPDVRTLNRADEMAQLAWGRELDPPQKVKQGTVLGNINLRPGSHTLMTDINGMAPLYEGTKFDVHTLNRDDKRQSVLRIYHVSEILNLIAREKLELTATEVQARLNLLQQILGPVFGRLEAEFLSVVIDVTFDNMLWRKMFAPVPEMLLKNSKLDVTYEGPLARAQRNQEILAYQAYQADIAQIANFSPDIARLPDWEKMARTIAVIRGVQAINRDKSQFSEQQAMIAKMKDMEAQLSMFQQMSKSLKDVSPFVQQMREGNAGAGGQELAQAA